MSTILLSLSLVLSLLALWAALVSLRAAPRRVVNELLLEQADQRAMLEKLLTRHRATASAENVSKARAVKADKASLAAEAAELLAAHATPPAPAQAGLALVPAGDDLNAWRKRAGIL